ncbi:MAG: YqgE/AlgH family protein [Gammaproteobacteria bacterium]|nr:YqgE/AlgH family protein [Gammaproteobacteria bacterium]
MLRNLKSAALFAAAAMVLALPAGPLHAQAPGKGKLLVATEDMRDPNYRRTVVLLLHHDSNGTIGVAINRPTWLSIEDVQPEAGSAEELGADVFRGGPLAPAQMIFLVRNPPAGVFDGQPILDRIYASGNLEQLRALSGSLGEEAIRLFAGHSEWAAGQLEAEIQNGQWIIVDGTAERVFETDPEDMWPRYSVIDSELLVKLRP